MLLTTAHEDKERWCGVTVPTAGRVSWCAPNGTHDTHNMRLGCSMYRCNNGRPSVAPSVDNI